MAEIDRNIEEERLANYLANRVCQRSAGHLDDVCLRNNPRDVYFIGNLRPAIQSEENSSEDHTSEIRKKLSPSAFGLDFKYKPGGETVELLVSLSWSLYYRVFPSYLEQCEHQKFTQEENQGTAHALDEKSSAPKIEENYREDEGIYPDPQEETSSEAAETKEDRKKSRRSKDSLFIVFKKIKCRVEDAITLQRDGEEWTADFNSFEEAIKKEFLRVRELIKSDPNRIRISGELKDKVKVSDTDLENEDAYQDFIKKQNQEVLPEWNWKVGVDLSSNEEDIIASLEFMNASSAPETHNTEPFFFDTKSTVSVKGASIVPFELELAPKGFRYDRNMWGRGFNCAVEYNKNEAVFETTHSPIYAQMRYATQSIPEAKFEDLAQNPIPVLENVLSAMKSYAELDWRRQRKEFCESTPDWEMKFGKQFEKDEKKYREEIKRFERGFELLKSNPDVLLAFKLTNETFFRAGDHPVEHKKKVSWRLFQIIFLVTQLPGIACLQQENEEDKEDRNIVDIVYFPTGGGKTEAYLATIVFHCFFDRLRGKAAGVTAWTRFPLRLLTLQQTQRMADVVGMAELIRKEQSDSRLSGSGVAGFAVGYFVGAGGSPNELYDPSKNQYSDHDSMVNWSAANDATQRQKWKRVIRCPSCKTSSVTIDFDPEKVRLFHRCTQSNCTFKDGIIPVYVVDNEIYRYLPSVIVGTIDKLASLGNQRKMAQFFGKIDGYCKEHGYFKGKCCQKDCTDSSKLVRKTPEGISSPSLFVQDELHLLKEGLGTFDSHYETFLQVLREEAGENLPLKIVASSATIEAFERQARHLYGREKARVFPGFGPTLDQSFYAHTKDFAQRFYVGIIPHNKTIFNTILELIETYHREIQALKALTKDDINPYSGAIIPGSGEWKQILDNYETSLTYFLAGRELDSIRTDIDGDVNPNLEKDDLNSLSLHELTGATSTDEVTATLEHLEKVSDGSEENAVLATSMISHGVDVDRFNSMIFYGMPRQTAEYIQASSRVGRSHAGIVFTCLHPIRERDRSHYSYFTKYHEFLGQLVEPVAINRWSQFSIQRTLPGLFMAILLQILSNQGDGNPNSYYMLDFIKKKVSQGEITTENFVELLKEAYLVITGGEEADEHFRRTIERNVSGYLQMITSASSDKKFVSQVIVPKPMRSLRDVDESIPIELDYEGSEWVERASA